MGISACIEDIAGFTSGQRWVAIGISHLLANGTLLRSEENEVQASWIVQTWLLVPEDL